MHDTAIGVFPATPHLIEWAAHTYNAVDYATFSHWHSQECLREIADMYEVGHLGEVGARNLVRQANESRGTDYTLEEIKDLSDRSVYVHKEDSIIFYSGENRDLFEFLSCALYTDHPLDALITGGRIINTVLMLTTDGVGGLLSEHFPSPSMVVLRSPRTAMCACVGTFGDFYELSDAMMSGSAETFSLPREAIGIINQEMRKRSTTW